jgi:hypothetical protein
MNNILGQLKTTGQDLPPQTHSENKGGSCLGLQRGRGCFLCGRSTSVKSC